jgi:hypothetical protein
MSTIALATIACVLAIIPACLFAQNLRTYAPPPRRCTGCSALSVLIPARNEEHTIAAAIEAALASRDVVLEVLVLDDHSEDATAAVVTAMAARDGRVRLLSAPPLPPGWCGKQHACAVLAQLAAYPLLVFIDADVRLAPEGLTRMAAFVDASGADLASGVPWQETGTWLERLVVPLIHFILLGFLPMRRMRQSRRPAYGTGCGQLFIIRRAAYVQAGGHGAIRASLHDGLTLPRTFRRAGFSTDLFDATEVATCRMYHTAKALWYGLTKNAIEGMAAPGLILPTTVLLAGGQILPPVLLGLGILGWLPPPACALAVLGTSAAYYPRLQAVRRFHQSLLGALLHPVGVLILLAIQWYAGVCWLLGRPMMWKGRSYLAR